MPPLPPVPNTLKAVIHWTIGSDAKGQTVAHFGYSGTAPNTAACTALAGNFRTACTAIDAMADTSCAMTEFVITDLASSLGAQGINTTSIACTRAGTGLAASSCAAVQFTVPNRYKGGKGKAFFPFGVAADLLNNQQWGSSFITASNTAVAAWAASFIGSSSGGCTVSDQRIVSYYAGYNPPTTLPSGKVKQTPKLRTGGPTWYVVNGYVTAAKVGSQRKRLSR